MVGEVLADRYELEELVGKGGMSSVFRARDRLLERTVALKVLHPQYAVDDGHVERFRREARSVAALSHPNIVTVIDRGEHEGRQFIVFEYVDGENLKRLVERRGPLPVPLALELGSQIASGLSFAHEQGFVHRDVKPQNVLLNGDGRAKVTDFGIARSLDVEEGMTQPGTVLGTSEYIAPEQAQGRAVGEQTDVYSLGVVLYELLTGAVPFSGESFVAVAMRHVNEEPPSVRTLRPDVPPRLGAAVRRAMAKAPADRFASMADLRAELQACLADLRETGTHVVAPPAPRAMRIPRRRRVSPWPVLVTVAALLAIGGGVAYLALHGIHPGKASGAGGGTAAAVALRAVGAYDPYGDGHEHDVDAPKATDGNPTTSWETETYFSAPSLDKQGVGLVLDAGKQVALRRLTVTTSTPGFTAEIRGGDGRGGPFDDVVAGPQTVQASTTFTLSATTLHRYYVLWITRLGPSYSSARVASVTAG